MMVRPACLMTPELNTQVMSPGKSAPVRMGFFVWRRTTSLARDASHGLNTDGMGDLRVRSFGERMASRRLGVKALEGRGRGLHLAK